MSFSIPTTWQETISTSSQKSKAEYRRGNQDSGLKSNECGFVCSKGKQKQWKNRLPVKTDWRQSIANSMSGTKAGTVRQVTTGQARIEHILVGDTWVSKYQWQESITAYRNRTATEEQLQLLKEGHWEAP